MWTRITDPVIRFGSRRASTRGKAMIDVYSYPCVPATSARTLPGRAPWTTLTGIRVPSSTASGTSIQPDAASPRAALTPPTLRRSAAKAGPASTGPLTTTAASAALTRSTIVPTLPLPVVSRR